MKKRFLWGLFPLFLALSAIAEDHPSVSFSTLLQKMVDLDSLYLDPNISITMWSSADRQGGNLDDTGYIRHEGSWSVIAEAQGPGAITRIWALNPTGALRIYIDDYDIPILYEPFQVLFQNKLSPFVNPFVYSSNTENGACWSYVPIPFSRFCKIVCEKLCYYQIETVTFPEGTKVEPLILPLSTADKNAITNTAKRFLRYTNNPPFPGNNEIQTKSVVNTIPAGASIEFASYAGPAVLRGIRIRWAGDNTVGRDLLLRIYWDGETEPSVLAPALDFFGYNVSSMALGLGRNSRRYCYFPMPYKKNMRIEIENGNRTKSCNVDLTLYPQTDVSLPDTIRYFHALWRRENQTCLETVAFNTEPLDPLCEPDQNYAALSARGKGHLVGISMLRTPDPESDAMIFIDQELLAGTGKNGFFDMAGTLQKNEWPLAAGRPDSWGGDVLLRLFFAAPLPFQQGVAAMFEHGSGNVRQCDYSSVVYWYQEEPHTRFPWPDPTPARRFRTAPIEHPIYEIYDRKGEPVRSLEAETLSLEAYEGIFDPQDMRPFGPDWSGDQQMRFKASKPGASIHFNMTDVDYSGWYGLICTLTEAPNAPRIEIQVNDTSVFPSIDLYGKTANAESYRSEIPVFIHASDRPRVSVIVLGKNENSTGYVAGIDCLKLVPNETESGHLLVQGPYALEKSDLWTIPHHLKIADDKRLFLGYSSINAATETNREYFFGNVSKTIPLPDKIEHVPEENALYYLTYTVKAEKTGIYAFEIESALPGPCLLIQAPEGIQTLENYILWNGIPLQKEKTIRYDPETNTVLPARFPVPLKKGENKISWQMKGDHIKQFRPRVYGLLP